MFNSMLAGIMISIGGIIYVQNIGIVGAILFAVGLATILRYGYTLFTGRAGYLASGTITIQELAIIWIGNLIGAIIMSFLVTQLPGVVDACHKIILARQERGIIGCFFAAIPCGILMYAATAKKDNEILFIVMCVAGFIMGGFYHCVADMFYLCAGAQTVQDIIYLIPVTLGNIVGCNILPLVKQISNYIANYSVYHG